MPPRIGPDDTARIVIGGNVVGCEWANVMWVSLPDSASAVQANLDAYLDAFAAAYHTNLMPQMTTSMSLTFGSMTVFRDGGLVQRSERTYSYGGSYSTGTDLTGQAALVLSWQVPLYYRGGHPRTYIPGLRSGQTSDGRTWSNSAVTAFATAAAGFLTAVNGITVTNMPQSILGLCRFVEGGTVLNPGQFTAFSGVRVHTRVDTQRRRLGRETV